jgi:hypothetical protein
MSNKLNLLVHINAYDSTNSSNSPTLNAVKWDRNYQGIDVNNARSMSFSLNSLDSQILHNGVVALTADNTTSYDLSLSPLGSYVLSYNSGTLPGFRTKRAISTDATTTFVITRSANVITYIYNAGTIPSFASVVIGDLVKIDAPFNVGNRGYYTIISKTSTSVSVVNYAGAEETVLLGLDFAQNFKIFSNGPLLSGHSIEITTGFSPVTLGSYIVEIVEDDRIFFSAQNLPLETGKIANVAAYSANKKMIYIESSEPITAFINGNPVKINPIKIGVGLVPGMLLLNGPVYSLSVVNNGVNASNIFYTSVE